MGQTLAVDTGQVCERIVTGVAALKGVDPTELPPLFEAVDPDALAAIFADTESGRPRRGHIGFTYADHRITVEFDDTDQPKVTID
ncbi:HalOD1 output domain-containing protein [Natrinema gelatinilyticum]|uniref:HalOD1 output domain-containing protein n=1 Tax=Natrinema gelatinilyticum TaxID=2961571 RepID=UPI0020C21B32|nr:HalOD1 output domain-containing protein [Natrinema gelatinilyticum]